MSQTNEIGTMLQKDLELQRCLDSIRYILNQQGVEAAHDFVKQLLQKANDAGIAIKDGIQSDYKNTIDPVDEVPYPGDVELEQDIRNIIRWNAMAMVVKANRVYDGIGGHISTYASSAVLYEVAFNHFFKGPNQTGAADQVFFQGHASPGMYARSYLEYRLDKAKLHNFRQDLSSKGGLSSYPHPYLMPDYWQFPTVSMGLGPINSIYQARFNKYLVARGLLKEDHSTVWCFVGDGEVDEPETLGALSIASREKLNNLIFVINCNLQSLDGPVRGNGNIVQELERIFKGASWHVLKVLWSCNWDFLFESEHKEALIKRMNETLDGEYQKFSVSHGSYIRKHFFGKDPQLLEAVSHLSDDELTRLGRGGHDPQKVYNAYKVASEHKEGPVVILAKTVKGYGLGEAGEGKNITHQQKKLNEKELREFRARFNIPLDDDEVVETPFYRPDRKSKVVQYVLKQREALHGFLPTRVKHQYKLDVPKLEEFQEFFKETKTPLSTTMAYVRVFSKLLKNKAIAKYLVPIIPDEARTFGMESLFRQIGIYSTEGQQYEPVDKDSLLYYKEAKDGQILEEGINEAGSMASFVAAASAYSTHGLPMIPFYIFYSMFGFQRVGDLIWLCADIQAKGFLMGATAGRTTLNGEGLQHQDGHSLLIAGTIPTCKAYDISFHFELAVIVQAGLKRMYVDDINEFYYLTIGNENYIHREMPKLAPNHILKGLYLLEKATQKDKEVVDLIGSGAITKQVIEAKTLLESLGVDARLWVATSYKALREEALEVDHWNLHHPDEKQKECFIARMSKKMGDVVIAASDNMRLVSDQIKPWLPQLVSLGTDGFGRSDTREALRDFFEVDAKHIAYMVIYQLFLRGKKSKSELQLAKKQLKVTAKRFSLNS